MTVGVTKQRLRTPQQLYEDWERAHWSARDVDLARDRSDWAAMEPAERDLLHWVLSSLMVAEERISTQFCGLVLAQDDEEEGSFLATQLVDEVRHMQFYARFQNAVIADRAAIGVHVERARRVLGAPFRKVFDEALVNAHDRLRGDPRNREAKVDFVTVYHMVIEGTLGVTASHFLLDFLSARDLLPGFVDGYGRIAADEQRHIAYGT
jgi:ribonucleoside-diphosphate reductase beta chain